MREGVGFRVLEGEEDRRVRGRKTVHQSGEAISNLPQFSPEECPIPLLTCEM